MIKVAHSEGVNIYCPKNGKFSFFNSPYFAHRNCASIDIYPNAWFNSVAQSPVNGEVIGIREVNRFWHKNFKCSDKDYVLLLRSLENKNKIVKILHLKPTVKVGDNMHVGEKIGVLIRSGFFDFWTEPHIHVEVRNREDPIRARGGCRIGGTIKIDDNMDLIDLMSIKGTVVDSKREYSLIAPEREFKHGIPVYLDEQIGFLDGGIPHYGFFGVHTNFTPKIGGQVKFLNERIGLVTSVFGNMCLATFRNTMFKLNGKNVRLSLYLFLSKPLLKIVPQRIGELNLEKFDFVELTAAST
ncbi:MAG: hypothetical protein QXU95_00670 [Candidatus Bathyarchaeia archaeon]